MKTVQFLGKTKKYSIRVKDISGGKESKSICAVNTIDEENGPPQFVYTTKVIFPSLCQPMPHKGMDVWIPQNAFVLRKMEENFHIMMVLSQLYMNAVLLVVVLQVVLIE